MLLSRAMRGRLRRWIGTVAIFLPPDRGPAPWRWLIAKSRVIVAVSGLGRAGDYDRAERTVRPILDNPQFASQACAVMARVREHRGDLIGALDAARRATSVEPVKLEALMEHHRLAAMLAVPDEPESLLARIFEEVARLQRKQDRPERTIVRALIRCLAWDELAKFITHGSLDGCGGTPPTDLPLNDLRRAAGKALSAGHTSAAVTLARIVLAKRPDDEAARETFDYGSDQLNMIASGWTAAPAGITPYQPRSTSVLSILAQSVPVTSGGYATRSHGVLTSLAARGWRVEAVTRLGFPYDRWPASDDRVVPASDTVDGITYHRILEDGVRRYPQYPLRSYVCRFADQVVQHAIRHQARLLHASSFHVNGLATADAARRLGLPFVYEMRGLEDLIRISRDPSFGGTDRYRFLTSLENEICHQADRVFVITEALRRQMARRGVSEDRMVVLPNGVDVDRFAPRQRDAELERELGVADKIVIGYAGGLVDYEGLDLLLEAIGALRQRRDDFHLIMVGDGHYQNALEALADRLKLGAVATFTGRVPHSQVGRYLSLFDIAPFPRWPLPVCEMISPIKPFESMAMGKAVIVSSVAALTEIVSDGRTGLVFAKGDVIDLTRTIERLLDSPELRTSLGTAGRDWVRTERDWSSIVEVVDTTYREVLARAGGPESPALQRLTVPRPHEGARQDKSQAISMFK
jgi:glycosyltransferase involved in cell wall biosynthesis